MLPYLYLREMENDAFELGYNDGVEGVYAPGELKDTIRFEYINGYKQGQEKRGSNGNAASSRRD